jgi:hypothetical protein
VSDARRYYELGNDYPYDTDDNGASATPKDWAHKAVRGVLADLCDRGGVKHALGDVDAEVREEIVASLAEVIRIADEERMQEILSAVNTVVEVHERDMYEDRADIPGYEDAWTVLKQAAGRKVKS